MGRCFAETRVPVTKAVFLDRDGVLNEAIVREGSAYSPTTLQEVVIPPEARQALDALRLAGFRLIMVTNQPDIARGKIAPSQVAKINRHICSMLPIDAIELCAHDEADDCDCRKPKPGMLLRAAKRDGIALSQSFMVGDRWRDIEAGRRAGCRTVLIGSGYGEGLMSPPDAAVTSLREAAQWILVQDAQMRGQP
jgi:D-glycero-D-manno-heptose 1,7-bisphosphate phosphatase